jgi:hypothetical protein
VRNVRLGDARYSLTYERAAAGRIKINVKRQRAEGIASAKSANDAKEATIITIAPALPLDARVRGVTLQGRPATFNLTRAGDVERPEISFVAELPDTEIIFDYDEGTEVYLKPQTLLRGETSRGLRILRSRAEAGTLRLLLEGRGGNTYTLGVRTPHKLGSAAGVVIKDGGSGRGDAQLIVQFDSQAGKYVRREINIPLQAAGR